MVIIQQPNSGEPRARRTRRGGSQPGEHDRVQRAVELPAAASVEAVADGLPAAGGDGRDAGERGEGGLVCDGLKGLPEAIGDGVAAAAIVQTSSERHWRAAGWSRRSPRRPERTYADACLRGPHADLSLLVEAGRVVASGSRASSAVMRFQPGRPSGDVSGKGHRHCWNHQGSARRELRACSPGSTGVTLTISSASSIARVSWWSRAASRTTWPG